VSKLKSFDLFADVTDQCSACSCQYFLRQHFRLVRTCSPTTNKTKRALLMTRVRYRCSTTTRPHCVLQMKRKSRWREQGGYGLGAPLRKIGSLRTRRCSRVARRNCRTKCSRSFNKHARGPRPRRRDRSGYGRSPD